MSNIFPETLAPNFFHVDKLPDYGLKLFENELGREIRRYTEDTGYKTELKIQYNGLRSDEVKALTAFYLQVKGTFDKFTLPINFYRSPSSITNSLTALADTTEWRFLNPPMIQTVISDIYTVEIRLLSLKDSLNSDSSRIIGFVNSVNVDFILPSILIPQQTQVTELVPIALEFIASSIDFNQSVTVNSIDLTLETSELTFTTSTSGSVDSRSILSLSLSFLASQTGYSIMTQTIQEEGNLVGSRSTLNFIGSVVTATDNPNNGRVDVTITPPTINKEGNLVGSRPTLNFVGSIVTATDNPNSNQIDITITPPTINQEDRIFGEIESPTVKEYTLEYFVSRPYRIKNLVIGTSTGTATVSIQINGVNVLGLDNLAVSSDRVSLSAGNNLATLSSTISLRVLSVNNATNLKFNLIYDYA